MTHEREQVKRALWYLEREPMPLRDLAEETTRRRRIALAVDARVREVSEEKEKGTFHLRALLAFAAAVALVGGLLWLRAPRTPSESSSPVAELEAHGSASVLRAGRLLPVGGVSSVRIAPADELRTEQDAHARAVLADGAVVDVDPSTSLRFDANGQAVQGNDVLRLDHGAIALKVPKLGSRRLSIRTPNATVTVRGTEFSVDVHEHEGHIATAVKVVEGSVWVTRDGREITLEKGSEWNSDARETVPVSPSAEQASEAVVPSPAPVTAGATSSPSSASAAARTAASVREEARSTLGVENDQYQRGVSAARAGDDRKALAAFEGFLSRYPTSPLAQSAEVERFRALKRLGRVDQAARKARQYLAAYPSGFARAEAQALAVESLGSPSAP